MNPLLRRVLLSAGGALLAGLAFPQPGIWTLLFVGVPVMVFAFRGVTLPRALLLGLVAGLVYYGSVVRWLTVYLGIVPWLALVTEQALVFALGGVLLAAAWRLIDRLNLEQVGWRLAGGLLLSGAWVARESLASNWPWGGFGWARVSEGLADSPFRYLVTLFGLPGASAVVVAFTVTVVLTWQQVPARRRRATQIAAIVAATLLLLPWPYLLLATAPSGSFRVAAVQGNSDSELFSTARPGDAIARHLAAMNAVPIGDVDAVIWPENAMDISPIKDSTVAAIADQVSSQHDADFLFGTITANGSQTFNSVLQWRADTGVIDQYDKVHPVPFAEYLPERDFFYPLAPSLFDMVPRDYTLGTRDPVMTIGKAVAGIAICYDIVDDGLFRTMLTDGANVIIAPTNNSDFGHTDESIQQLGIARLRAVETGRAVVNVSTVGVSAIIAPDGSDLARLQPFAPGVMVNDVPLSTVVTPATIIGVPLEWVLALAGLAPLLGVRRKPTA